MATVQERAMGYGDGSVYQRADGQWCGSLTVSGPGEPRRRKVIYGPTEPAVKREMGKLRRRLQESGTLPTVDLTVSQWMKVWLEDIAAERIRPSTMVSHSQKVRLYIDPLIGTRRLDRLTPDDIRGMYRQMAHLSPNTRRQTHAILSRALTVAVREGNAPRNAAQLMDAPPVDTPDIDVLNPTEIAAILTAAAGDRLESRWVAALHLGLRQGEALALGWEQVDLDQGTLSVIRSLGRQPGKGLVMGPPKSKKSIRTVPLTDPLWRSLERRRTTWEGEAQAPGYEPHGLVWGQVGGRPLDPRRDYQAWKDLLEKAEVRDVRLHDARHAAATALGALGVPMQVMGDILGHSQIQTTSRYTHTDLTAMRAATDLLGRKALA